MRRFYQIAISLIAIIAISASISAQEILPCSEEKSVSELRATGTGSGNTAFEALTNAVTNAMTQIKVNVSTLFPNKRFEYSVLSKYTAEGEEIELETTLGQPNICDEKIECDDNGKNCNAAITINFDATEWFKEQEINFTE